MANEITVNSSLAVKKGNMDFQSRPTQIKEDQTGTGGPTPGVLSISTSGVSVSLSELTTAGYVLMQNLGATNFVEFGTYPSSTFSPLGELLPGKQCVLRLSRNLATLRLEADTAACDVAIYAFEA